MSVVATDVDRSTHITSRDRFADAARVALAAAGARLLGALIILRLGFRVVSDDDFARVVIAQRFAAHPKLDPTGTSWLPLPFWIVGSVMRVFGSTLEVARILAVIGAMFGGALVASVAVLVGLPPRRAVAAALVAALMPWAMQLAVATVPEAPAAACAAVGAIVLASSSPRLRIVGAFALLASCWSRYDAWPTAIVFALYGILDAAKSTGKTRVFHVASAVVAVGGPAVWTTWQAAVYHDPFRYLGLVRSYRQALGGGAPLVKRLLGYPLGAFEEMREVVGAGVVALIGRSVLRRRRARGDEAARTALDWTRPLILAAFQLFVLVLGDVKDGAPTHHAERALLGPATIVLFAASDVVGAWLSSIPRSRAWQLGSIFAALLGGWIALRLHRSLPWYDGAPRPREVELGRALASIAPPGARVLLDTRDLAGNSPDYGYYAVLAAFGRPVDVDVDRDQDPRKPHRESAFRDVEALSCRIDETRTTIFVAWGEAHRDVALATGAHAIAEERTGVGDPRWFVMAR